MVVYFPRRPRSFNTCCTILRVFYQSLVASAILFAVVCWGSELRVADANRFNKLICIGHRCCGSGAELSDCGVRRKDAKVQAILDNVSHPHHDTGVHLVNDSSYQNASIHLSI